MTGAISVVETFYPSRLVGGLIVW